MLGAAALTLVLSTTPVQTNPNGVVIARAVAASLPDTQYDWALRWNAVASRLSRDVRWNLSEPGADETDDLPEGVYRRQGWISSDGASGSVAVCGTRDQVLAFVVSLSNLDVDADEVIAGLTGQGVHAQEVSRIDARIPTGRIDDHYRALVTRAPRRVVWLLQKPGFGDAHLTADHICTPPGTRSASRCWFRFTVDFVAADDASPTACPLPGRLGI